MRILLVKIGRHLYYSRNTSIPLGIMYLASYLREKRKWDEIRIIDMKAEGLGISDVSKIASEFNPDVIGLSSMSTDSMVMHDVAKSLKKTLPQKIIVAGGPHPTSDPEDTLKNNCIDVAVIGEGEVTFYELISLISENKSFYNIPGIAYRSNGNIVITEPRKLIENLDSLPLPAWDLINLDTYAKHFGMSTPSGKRKYASIITSRGCPYRCTYCHNIFGKKFRTRSPDNVINEFLHLYRKGVRDFEIIDDIFNLDKKRAIEIMDKIIASGIEINIDFPNGLRGDILDEEILNRLKKAGTRSICFAIESASERIQKLIKKNLKLESLKRNIDISDKLGILNMGYFMFGFPGETLEEIKKTIDYAIKSSLHIAFFFILNPFKGTEIYSQIEEMNLPLPGYEDYNYYFGQHNYSSISTLRLRIMLRWGLLKFYFWKFRIIKTFFRMPAKQYALSLSLVELYRIFSLKNIFFKKLSNPSN